MTSRYIDPLKLTPEARAIARVSSQLPGDFNKYAYHGDVAPKPVQPRSNISMFKELYSTVKATKAELSNEEKQRLVALLSSDVEMADA